MSLKEKKLYVMVGIPHLDKSFYDIKEDFHNPMNRF